MTFSWQLCFIDNYVMARYYGSELTNDVCCLQPSMMTQRHRESVTSPSDVIAWRHHVFLEHPSRRISLERDGLEIWSNYNVKTKKEIGKQRTVLKEMVVRGREKKRKWTTIMCTVEMKGRALGSWSEEFLFLRRYMTVATMCQPAKHTCRPWVYLINYQSPWQRGSFWLTLALAAYFNIKVKRHRALHRHRHSHHHHHHHLHHHHYH